MNLGTAHLACEFGLQGHLTGCRTGNGDQLNSTQAQPGQAIKSAVAYFPSISCATSCRVALYLESTMIWLRKGFQIRIVLQTNYYFSLSYYETLPFEIHRQKVSLYIICRHPFFVTGDTTYWLYRGRQIVSNG